MIPHTRTWYYNCKDTAAQILSYHALKSEINEDPNEARVYQTIVRPLTLGVMRMRRRGLMVDEVERASLYDKLTVKLGVTERKFKESIGDWFVPSNRDHLRKLIFEHMGFTPLKLTKVRRQPQMDQLTLITFLLENENPIFDELIDYLRLHKMRSTFVDGIRPARDGRVRAYWLIHGTATGRLSCREPDLQNIPIRHTKDVRNMFVAPRGSVLVSADASQLELRLLAYATNCTALIELLESGADAHTTLAARAYKLAAHEVSPDRRYAAKKFRYTDVYGATDERVREAMIVEAQLRVSLEEIASIRAADRASFPEIYSEREKWYEIAKRTRMVRNDYGRVRRLFIPEADIRGVALNTPIQSTAADYINTAFVELDRQEAPLVCQVHDELLLESPKSEWRKWSDALKRVMEKEVELFGRRVRLPCKISVGESWGHLETVA